MIHNVKIYQKLGITLIFSVIIFFHIYNIGSIPRGLYIDESSVGYNADLIAKTGYDEHNELFPLYFKSFFGERTLIDPLYIYTTSFVFLFTNPSEASLRFASFIFFIIFLFGFYFLTKELFKEQPSLIFYSVITAGFLPWFFTFSRLAFPVISQLPMIILALLFLFKTFNKNQHENFYAALCGIFSGLWVYTYGTARLTATIFIISVVIVYFSYKNLKKILTIIKWFLIILIPYIVYFLQNPKSLFKRFEYITLFNNPAPSLNDKIWLFVKNYFSYIYDTNFLVFSGDANFRHSIGIGEIFITTFILYLIGILYFATKNFSYFKENRFSIIILINFFIAPIPISLIEPSHALRGLLIGIYILIISCFGFYKITNNKIKIIRNSLIAAIFLVLTIECTFFLYNYFIIYPPKSAIAFESYNFKDCLSNAIKQNPQKIIVSSIANVPYGHLEFYKRTIGYNGIIEMTIALPVAEKNICVIYFPAYAGITNPNYYPIKYKFDSSYTKLRCY